MFRREKFPMKAKPNESSNAGTATMDSRPAATN